MTGNEQRTENLQRSLEAAAEGRRLVAEELRALESIGWVVLHDLHWPGRRRAKIDHVAVGPGGVVVVDSRNWSGDVTVDDGRLRQNGRSRGTVVEALAAATAAVTAHVPAPHRGTTAALLCLVGQEQAAEQLPNGVGVVGRTQLVAAIGARPQVLTTAADVLAVAGALRAELTGSTAPAGLTTADLDAETQAEPAPEPEAQPESQVRPEPVLAAPSSPRTDAVAPMPQPRAGAARRALRALRALVPVLVAVGLATGRT